MHIFNITCPFVSPGWLPHRRLEQLGKGPSAGPGRLIRLFPVWQPVVPHLGIRADGICLKAAGHGNRPPAILYTYIRGPGLKWRGNPAAEGSF